MYKTFSSEDAAKMAELSPIRPAGYQVLIAIPEVNEKTTGGVFIPDELKAREQRASVVALVLKTGVDAYADTKKFPNGPYCKQGDWILFRSYGGQSITVNDHEERCINDDTVLGLIDDPSKVKRT